MSRDGNRDAPLDHGWRGTTEWVPPEWGRLRFRTTTIATIAVVFTVLAGLALVSRSLTANERALAELDALETAVLVEEVARTSLNPRTAIAERLAAPGARWPAQRRQVLVLDGGDTVVSVVRREGSAGARATASARLPAGRRVQVEVMHATGGRLVRVAFWVMALGALGALLLALTDERRQARRLAERSVELEQLSAELIRANRAKSEFLANVSHELRTPLNAIVGFADLLREGVYGELNPRQSGPVERIEASATHLRLLVDQILDLAKMAAGRLEVHPEPVDLRPFVLDIATEVESLLSEKGLQLQLAIPATLPRVHTDPTHLRQVLVNLLGNAIKYTERGTIAVRGKLVAPAAAAARAPAAPATPRRTGEGVAESLRAQVPDAGRSWVALQVADTGIGIAPKDRDRIFDEFEQVNAGPRGDSMRRGTGLGLSISRRLARLLGGDISLESEVGKGSVFTLWLPVE